MTATQLPGIPPEVVGVPPEKMAKLEASVDRLTAALTAAVAGHGSSLDLPLSVTFFKDVFAVTKVEKKISLRELSRSVARQSGPKKERLPLLKMGRFGETRTDRNSLRHDANLLEISGIEGDYDGKLIPLEIACKALLKAGVSALAYTSPGHTVQGPTWRVICPCSRPLPPSVRTKLVQRLNRLLGGVLAPESFTRSQTYYYGSVNSNPAHRVELVDGRPIDLADDLDEVEGATATGQQGEADNDAVLDALSTSPLGLAADDSLVVSALSVIPNEGPAEWNGYNRILMAVWAATDGSEAGREAAEAWSAKNVCHSPEVFDERWNHYSTSPPTSIGAGSIFHLAKRHGWRDPRAPLPDLLVRTEALPETAVALVTLLAQRPMLFERQVPVRLAFDTSLGGLTATSLSAYGVVREAHAVCAPYVLRQTTTGVEKRRITLPIPVAQLYLDMRGEWKLRPLAGIAASPLLSDDGGIRGGVGYDAPTGLYRESVPHVEIAVSPTLGDAKRALKRLRMLLRTFAFADADLVQSADGGTLVVDLNKPPARDESAALTALLTAVARPSLDLAPGILIRAPAVSGSGIGKGLLGRFVCVVAFGRSPAAITAGHNREELEKRVVAALLDVNPAVLLDNLNGFSLRSDTLASVLTERPARTRVLGSSETALLNSSALILATGNGLSVSEDLARRFVDVQLDAKTEDPEARRFKGDFLEETSRDRLMILSDVLTIWRWGRQQGDSLPAGRPLGSYNRWAKWCRDPLLALGCQDVVERVAEAKANDPYRRQLADVLLVWWRKHRERPVKVAGLDLEIQSLLDPHRRGRQFIASKVAGLVGAQLAGFTLTRSDSGSKWGAATYALHAADDTAADAAALDGADEQKVDKLNDDEVDDLLESEDDEL